ARRRAARGDAGGLVVRMVLGWHRCGRQPCGAPVTEAALRKRGVMKSWSRSLVGAVSGFIVWAAHFAIVYSLVGVGCAEGWHRAPLAGVNALTMLLLGVTLPALALIAWIGRGGWHAWAEANGLGADRDDRARLRFMG